MTSPNPSPTARVTLDPLGALAIGVGTALAGASLAFAIPSRTPHPHTSATVTWSIDGSAPPADPNTTAHQHRSVRSFRGLDDR